MTPALIASIKDIYNGDDELSVDIRTVCDIALRATAAESRERALREALEFYADPELYKPHPHGPAFGIPDLSFCARAALEGKVAQ